MKTKHLGKHDFKPQTGYKILDPIERIRSSESHGYDFWNAYEFSYLDINKQPTLKVLEIKIPAASDFIIESKSLKLYLFSFRNHGGFHEECVQMICSDLFKLMKPAFIEVIGEFTPRGGISIFPYSSMSSKVKKYQEIKESRLKNYSPGKYSCELSRVY